MRIALIAIGAYLVLGTLVLVRSVGKERKPTTGGEAAVLVLINAAIVTTLVLAAGRLR